MNLTENDIKLIKKFCVLNEEELFHFLKHKCTELGYKEIYYKKDHYLYVKGDNKYPTLVAHLDTVRSVPLKNWDEFFYDREERVLWCPELAGFDDRAGVFAIYKILTDTQHRPSLLFTVGEEVGGVGVLQFAEDFQNKVKTKFFIELDRQGLFDSVYYNCKNPTFEKYINSYGFETAKGIFSDVYYLSPCFHIASVNLSIGYLDEHTFAERLYLDWFESTLYKVIKLLDEVDKVPYFLNF